MLTSPRSVFRASVFLQSELALRKFRAVVLQQDAEVWFRMDWYYDSFPRAWFRMRLPGSNLRTFLEDTRRLPNCCVDIAFTQRALARPQKDFDQSFIDALASVDLDDSIATIVENERQHGRLRMGYGCRLQALERSLSKACSLFCIIVFGFCFMRFSMTGFELYTGKIVCEVESLNVSRIDVLH